MRKFLSDIFKVYKSVAHGTVITMNSFGVQLGWPKPLMILHTFPRLNLTTANSDLKSLLVYSPGTIRQSVVAHF